MAAMGCRQSTRADAFHRRRPKLTSSSPAKPRRDSLVPRPGLPDAIAQLVAGPPLFPHGGAKRRRHPPSVPPPPTARLLAESFERSVRSGSGAYGWASKVATPAAGEQPRPGAEKQQDRSGGGNGADAELTPGERARIHDLDDRAVPEERLVSRVGR